MNSRLATIGTALAVLVFSGAAGAHDAPTGWSYPPACCSDIDCRDVPADWVFAGPDGYRIVITGEVVRYGDSRLRPPPDGLVHWCSVAGSSDSRTICLFVPEASS